MSRPPARSLEGYSRVLKRPLVFGYPIQASLPSAMLDKGWCFLPGTALAEPSTDLCGLSRDTWKAQKVCAPATFHNVTGKAMKPRHRTVRDTRRTVEHLPFTGRQDRT